MRGITAFGASIVCAVLLTSCSDGFGPFATCPEGDSVSDRELVEVAVDKLVREIRASKRSGEVHYQSTREFYERNPACCYIEEPSGRAGDELSLPFRDQVRLAIVFRRFEEGDKPYDFQHITIGRCLTHMEESGRLLSEVEFRRLLISKWEWKVR